MADSPITWAPVGSCLGHFSFAEFVTMTLVGTAAILAAHWWAARHRRKGNAMKITAPVKVTMVAAAWVLFLLVGSCLFPACAGTGKVDPRLEAYIEDGEHRGAVGIRLPGVQVDSDGLIVGPDTRPIGNGMAYQAQSMDKLSRWVAILGVVGLLGLGFYVWKKKKD